jgi:hypothetical protein
VLGEKHALQLLEQALPLSGLCGQNAWLLASALLMLT